MMQKSWRVILLSGTPIVNWPKEIFNLLRLLRPDILKDFYEFGNWYCDPKKD